MTTPPPEQPVIDIELHDSRYCATLTMHGVRQVHSVGDKYNDALLFAEGMAASLVDLAGYSVVQAFPLSEADFIQRQSAPVEDQPA